MAATVPRGCSGGRCVCRASDAADTQLAVTSLGDGERWLRAFDGRRFDSRQYQAADSVLGERMGILDFRFQLDVCDGSPQAML